MRILCVGEIDQRKSRVTAYETHLVHYVDDGTGRRDVCVSVGCCPRKIDLNYLAGARNRLRARKLSAQEPRDTAVVFVK